MSEWWVIHRLHEPRHVRRKWPSFCCFAHQPLGWYKSCWMCRVAFSGWFTISMFMFFFRPSLCLFAYLPYAMLTRLKWKTGEDKQVLFLFCDSIRQLLFIQWRRKKIDMPRVSLFLLVNHLPTLITKAPCTSTSQYEYFHFHESGEVIILYQIVSHCITVSCLILSYRGLDPGGMLSLPTLHPKQRRKSSKGAGTAPRNGSVGSLKKLKIMENHEENHRIEQGQRWKRHQTQKLEFFLCLIFPGGYANSWMSFILASFVSYFAKREYGKKHLFNKSARKSTENLSNRNDL